MSYWANKAHRRYQQKKALREEFWDDVIAGILSLIFHPIRTFKNIRKNT